MAESEVLKFMENFGSNSVADMCLLWLIRKRGLYFQSFTKDVVRWLLLAFCNKSLNDPQVITWMKVNSQDMSHHMNLIDKLWTIYCDKSKVNCVLGIEDIEQIREIVKETRRENYDIIREERGLNRRMLKSFYENTFPAIISAKREAFEKHLDIEALIKTAEDYLNGLKTLHSKEQFIETMFKDYGKSFSNYVFALIMFPNDVCEDNCSKSQETIINAMQPYVVKGHSDKSICRKHYLSYELKSMITATHPETSAQTPTDVVISELGAFINPLHQFAEALNVLLANNNIVFTELKEKLGLSIDIKVNINFPNIDMHKSPQPDMHLPIITKEGINLPDILNTERARKIFVRAYEKGWIKSTSEGGFEWKGFKPRPSNTQLAYLCGKIYGYKHGFSGNEGEHIPYEQLEELFHIKKMAFLLHQAYEKDTPQLWRRLIDELVAECE